MALRQTLSLIASLTLAGVLACSGTVAHGEPTSPLPPPAQSSEAELQLLKADAYALGRQRRFREAIAKLEQAALIQPDDADVHGMLGSALFRSGFTDKAVTHLQRAQELDPDDYRIAGQLGGIYKSMGRYDEAESSFREVLRVKPGDAGSLANLGDIGFRSKRYSMCVEFFDRFLANIESLDPELLSERDKGRYRHAQELSGACQAAADRP